MAFPWAAAIGLGGSLISGGLGLMGQSQQSANQAEALRLAMMNYQLQQRQMDRQWELATAGQTDARGNRLIYTPDRGWVTYTSPQTQSLINQSDAVQRMNMAEAMGRGRLERGQAFDRRQQEGVAASPLLQQFMQQYGAPTRESVAGANTIANVTGANENADAIRSGYTSAALRTGGSISPLQQSLSSLDRGATAGVRSALARGAAEGGPLFQQMMDQYTGGKLNPYNTLATRASNVENMPFQPEQLTGNLDAAALNRAAMGTRYGVGQAPGSNALLAAMASQRQPNYDTFAAGVTANLKNLPWSEWFGDNGGGSPSITRKSSTQTYF